MYAAELCCRVCVYAFMCVCMYVCVHVCVYACMCVRMYVALTCMRVCGYACMHALSCMCVCMCAYYAFVERGVKEMVWFTGKSSTALCESRFRIFSVGFARYLSLGMHVSFTISL
jgi:hypothetical protein